MLLIFILPRVLFIFKFCTFPVFLKCSRFFGGVPGFLWGVPGFLWVFRVFLGMLLVSSGCSGFFWGVFLVFWVFRDVPGCSGVPCSGVPGSTTCRRPEGCIWINTEVRGIYLTDFIKQRSFSVSKYTDNVFNVFKVFEACVFDVCVFKFCVFSTPKKWRCIV